MGGIVLRDGFYCRKVIGERGKERFSPGRRRRVQGLTVNVVGLRCLKAGNRDSCCVRVRKSCIC